MSTIPPDVLGSALQAGFAAGEAGRLRDAEKAGQAQAALRQARAAAEATDSVETADNDTAVFADAEGAGGQGRPFEHNAEENSPEAGASDGESLCDGDGRERLDLQA